MNRERILAGFRAEVVPERLPRGNADRLGYVYFVTDGNAVKIGFSEIPSQRIADLQSSCPAKLERLALIKGSIRDEQALHRKFHALRLHGEWFTLTPELRSQIAMLQEQEDNRTEFDAYLGWYAQRRGTLPHPIMERQAFFCSRDVELLRMNKGVPVVRRIVGESLAHLGAMVAAERQGRFHDTAWRAR